MLNFTLALTYTASTNIRNKNGGIFLPLQPCHPSLFSPTPESLNCTLYTQTSWTLLSVGKKQSLYDGCFKFRRKRRETIYWTSNFLIPQTPIKLSHVSDILSQTVDEWHGRGRIFLQTTNWLPFTLKSYLFQQNPIYPRKKRQWISLAFYFS